jgi:hypothetical protein
MQYVSGVHTCQCLHCFGGGGGGGVVTWSQSSSVFPLLSQTLGLIASTGSGVHPTDILHSGPV